MSVCRYSESRFSLLISNYKSLIIRVLCYLYVGARVECAIFFRKSVGRMLCERQEVNVCWLLFPPVLRLLG